MMLGSSAQQSIRKYVGAIKDSTTVGLAKVSSDYKELDIAIVKATRHFENPSKEKHVRDIFAAISPGRPRADIIYCIRALAWEYSSWIRKYALFLEEKLECFRLLKHDIETEPSKAQDLNATELLEQLPALQQLLFRLLECEPQRTTMNNYIIQLALSMFFDLQRHMAIRALDIYKKSNQQVVRLLEFHETCKRLHVWHGWNLAIIEQSNSLLQNMVEYVKNTKSIIVQKDQVANQIVPKEIMQQECTSEIMKEIWPAPPSEPVKLEMPFAEPADFLGPSYDSNSSDDQSTDKLDIDLLDLTSATIADGLNAKNGTTRWELDLLVPDSMESSSDNSKLAGGFDRLTLDSLYDAATSHTGMNASYDHTNSPPNEMHAIA